MSLNVNDSSAVNKLLDGVQLMEGRDTAEACRKAIEKLRSSGSGVIEDVFSFVIQTQERMYAEQFQVWKDNRPS